MSTQTTKTIFMRRADWERWDADLRAGHPQGKNRLETEEGHCCLGRLQMCLNGEVEKFSNGTSCSVPSGEWLEAHNIQFFSQDGVTRGLKDSRIPFLPTLEMPATEANDTGTSFVEIADAIKECVEFIDEVKP